VELPILAAVAVLEDLVDLAAQDLLLFDTQSN
jgi:hypothetical protein